MFYNNNNHFIMGEFVVSPILLITPSTDGTFTATVVIAGIVVVMAVLILMIAIFQGFGTAVSKSEEKAKKRAMKKQAKMLEETDMISKKKKKETKAPVAASPAPAPAPVVESGISGEIVAAIAAAVAVSEGEGAVIQSISAAPVKRALRKVNVSGRNPWAQAAVVDNTRPF